MAAEDVFFDDFFGTGEGGETINRSIVVVDENFTITQGDSVKIEWRGDTADQWPDLTGATIKFAARHRLGQMIKAITADTVTGLQVISMTPTQAESSIASAVYPYDVEATWDDGRRHTLAKGYMTVEVTYTNVPTL